MSQVLRPVGALEKVSTSRHALGFFRAVLLTGRYRLSKDQHLQSVEQFKDTLYLALGSAIAGHPALWCSIHGEDTQHPVYKRLDSIDFDKVVSCVHLERPEALVHELEQLHDELFPSLDRLPPWRLVVFLPPPRVKRINVVYIAFVFHHSLVDGLSGASFHRSLLHELGNTTIPIDKFVRIPHIVNAPPNLRLPSPIEELVKMPMSWSATATQFLQRYGLHAQAPPTTPWPGTICKGLDDLPYRTRLRIVSISAHGIERWLRAARKEKSTLTSLMSGLVVVALADQVPSALRFVGATPYSIRKFSGTNMDAMVNQASLFDTSYDQGLLDDIRATSDMKKRVWKAAHYFQSTMEAELSRCPSDNIIGKISQIPNYRQFFQSKVGKAREATFGVSNLGALTFPSNGDWALDDIIFSQSPHVVGPAFAVSTAGVRGGKLNLVMSWQDGVVDESLIEGVAREFERFT